MKFVAIHSDCTIFHSNPEHLRYVNLNQSGAPADPPTHQQTEQLSAKSLNRPNGSYSTSMSALTMLNRLNSILQADECMVNAGL